MANEQSAAKHTPGPLGEFARHWPPAPSPWSLGPSLTILDADGHVVARLSSTRGKFEPEEVNALRIVQCVNAHDELVATMRKVVTAWESLLSETKYVEGIGDRLEDMEFREMQAVRAAIAKATGSAS